MKTGIYLRALPTLLSIFCLNMVIGQSSNSYILDISDDMRNVTVEADLEVKGNYLLMNWESATFLEDGWSQFVNEINAFTSEGEVIELEYIQPGRWKMATSAQRVHIEYVVSIEHDKIVWEEGGHDESAYVLNELLFMIGRVVFISAGQIPENSDPTHYEVEFKDLREDFKVTTTWEPLTNSDRKWLVQSTNELLSSVILIGKQHQQLVKNENIEVVLAGAPEYQSGLETFASVFEILVPTAQNRLGALNESKFVLVANVAPATLDPYFSGGVLNRSISIISPFIPDESVLPMVQHLLFHEYLHLYTMEMNVAPDEVERNYWFLEGVHDYISNKLLYESGLIDQLAFLNGQTGILGNWNAYENAANRINIMEAGKEKFENYELIYNGGHSFGAVLDISLLSDTGGGYGLIDFWSELIEKQTVSEIPLDFNAIYKIAVERGGEEVKDLLDRHIIGNEPIPLPEYLNRMGLEISPAENNSADQIIVKDGTKTVKFKFP